MDLKFVAIWGVVTILSVMFLFGSSIKMFAWNRPIFDTQMEMIRRYGLNRELYFLIGVVECFGAIAILWNGQHWIAAVGALAILTTSIGAMACHIIFDKGRYIVPSIVSFSLSLVVLVYNWPALESLLLR